MKPLTNNQRVHNDRVQFWSDTFEQFESSGLTIAEFCKLNNLSNSKFYQWRKRLLDIESASKQNQSCSTTTDNSISFIPVSISTDSTTVTNKLTININGATIDVDDSTNLDFLSKVVGVLR